MMIFISKDSRFLLAIEQTLKRICVQCDAVLKKNSNTVRVRLAIQNDVAFPIYPLFMCISIKKHFPKKKKERKKERKKGEKEKV